MVTFVVEWHSQLTNKRGRTPLPLPQSKAVTLTKYLNNKDNPGIVHKLVRYDPEWTPEKAAQAQSDLAPAKPPI